MDVDSNQDIIDSRDVIARIEELEELGTPEHPEDGEDAFTGLDQDEANELESLRKLAEQGENWDDWNYGVTLIRETYFEEHARQLASDLGMVVEDAAWPACHIDWEAAADALRVDYGTVEYEGVTYYAR